MALRGCTHSNPESEIFTNSRRREFGLNYPGNNN